MGWDGMYMDCNDKGLSVNSHQAMFAGYIKGLLFRNGRVPCSDWVGNYRLPRYAPQVPVCLLPVCADAQN